MSYSSQFFFGSLCLSDIPQEHITTAKNGKKYLNIAIFERKEKGKFGETHTIMVNIPKEQRKPNDTPVFIGNLKEWEGSKTTTSVPINNNDDLPF